MRKNYKKINYKKLYRNLLCRNLLYRTIRKLIIRNYNYKKIHNYKNMYRKEILKRDWKWYPKIERQTILKKKKNLLNGIK